MVLYGVCMILCGLVWFSIAYAHVFPCKVSNCLVWLSMVLYSLTQLCTIFVLIFLLLKLSKSKISYCHIIEMAGSNILSEQL